MISWLPLLAHRILSALKRIAHDTQRSILEAMFRHGPRQKCLRKVCDRCHWRIDVAVVGGLLPADLWSRGPAGVH